MSTVDVNAIHRKDRRIVLAGLGGVTALCWAYLVYLAWRMAATPSMSGMVMPQWQPWGVVDLLLVLLMWAVMMAAMMVPSATPMILTFASLHRRSAAEGDAIAPTVVFLVGYAIAWSVFSLAATLVQWGLHEAALLSPMMVSTSPIVGGLLLIAAGGYQWSKLKRICLSRCRTPVAFLLSEWREGARGALVMGMRHGAFCIGCCWALMALLFVGGVMNLLWVAVIAVFVLVEKLAPQGFPVASIAGLGLVAWGGWMLLGGIL